MSLVLFVCLLCAFRPRTRRGVCYNAARLMPPPPWLFQQLWVEREEKVRGKAALLSLMSNLIPHGGKHWAVNLAAIRLAAEVMGGGILVWGPQLFWKSLCRYLQHVDVWSAKDEFYFSRESHICQVYCPIIPIHLSSHWMPIRFTGWCRYMASGWCQRSATAELVWLATPRAPPLPPSPRRGLPGRGNLPKRARSLPAMTPCAETRGGLEFQLGPSDEDVRDGARNACQMSLQSGGDTRGLAFRADDEAACCTRLDGCIATDAPRCRRSI